MLKDQRPPERESVWSVAKEWLPWCLLLIFLLTFIWTAFVAWVEATPSHRPVCNLLQAIKNWTVGRPGNEATNGELKSRNESRETKVWTRKYGSSQGVYWELTHAKGVAQQIMLGPMSKVGVTPRAEWPLSHWTLRVDDFRAGGVTPHRCLDTA